MAEFKVIDWEEAMNQVGGDSEFLEEVLTDLIAEADSAQSEIEHSISEVSKCAPGDSGSVEVVAGHCTAVMKSAHRIKGSASYLCCERLKDVSFLLQNAGHDVAAIRFDAAEFGDNFQKIVLLFDQYKSHLADLKTAIENKPFS